MPKTKIYLVNAVLGTGKTRFLNTLLQQEDDRQMVAVLQCEQGKSILEDGLIRNIGLYAVLKAKHTQLYVQGRKIQSIDTESAYESLVQTFTWLTRYSQLGLLKKVYLEYNGTWSLQTLLKCLQKFPGFSLEHQTLLIQAEHYVEAQGEYTALYRMTGAWEEADSIYLLSSIEAHEKTKLAKQMLRGLGFTQAIYEKEEQVERALLKEKQGWGMKFGYVLCFIWAFALLWLFLRLPNQGFWLEKVQNYARDVFSLCLQIFPFLLLSSLLSSFIQTQNNGLFGKIPLFSSRERKRRAEKSWRAVFAEIKTIFLLMLSGFLLPICDCGLIPVWTRLVRKGMKFEHGVLFFLSSCVNNPMVLLSMFFAFPERKSLVFYRLFWGLALAFLSYVVLSLYTYVKGRNLAYEVQELYCLATQSEGSVYGEGRTGFLFSLSFFFSHVSNEFFILSRNVIFGIAISTAVHRFLPRVFLQNLASGFAGEIFLLLLALFFMGVCANANAFLAKTFLGLLSNASLLLYMLFSPLLDFKNLLLIRQGFGKKLLFIYASLMLIFLLFFFFLLPQLPEILVPNFSTFAYGFA